MADDGSAVKGKCLYLSRNNKQICIRWTPCWILIFLTNAMYLQGQRSFPFNIIMDIDLADEISDQDV